MRILFFGNNWTALQVLDWLKKSSEEIVGLVIHPEGRCKYGREIVTAAGLRTEMIFDGSRLKDQQVLSAIQALKPEIGLSVFFGYILKPELLNSLPHGCLNLHPALLPYNRGSFPNVWSIIEGTPAGATLHFVDTGVDTGDILAQVEVPVDSTDNGKSLYRKLEVASVELFKENWEAFKNGELRRRAQSVTEGTSHRMKDVEALDEIDLDRRYKARDLINILRARTFPPYRGAYFKDGPRTIYLRLHLSEESNEDV